MYTCIAFCSFELYTISHRVKYGVALLNLSQDSEAHVPDCENFSAIQLSIERVIRKILNKYGVDMEISES